MNVLRDIESTWQMLIKWPFKKGNESFHSPALFKWPFQYGDEVATAEALVGRSLLRPRRRAAVAVTV